MRDLDSFGLFFEDFAVRDLSVYASSMGGVVKHYRDNAGLECDAVVHLEDGRWGGIEIKLGGDDLINDGAESLKKLRDKIVEKSDEKAPSFLLVLTAVGGAYKREDGVFVAPINLLRDLDSFGLFFEDFAVRDLSVYASSMGGVVKHYRDNAGLECDAVVHLEDGRWGGIEIKLGGDDLINDGAESLKKLRDKIVEKSDEKAPSFLLVLTAVGGAYKREDGVFVAPINLLRP